LSIVLNCAIFFALVLKFEISNQISDLSIAFSALLIPI